MVLLTFLTLCTFHKKRGRGKGGGGAYETTKSKNQSALNCTMLARLTHVPIKKTNTKRFRKRANQSCGSLSPNTSQQTRRKPIARCWLPNSPANMSALSTQPLLISSREKKMHKALRESVKTAMQASLQLPTEQLPTKHRPGVETQSSTSLTFRTRFHSPVV